MTPVQPAQLTCFKAYDIRGRLGEELNEQIAYCIGKAYALHLKAKKIVVGGDARATSEALKLALAQGMQDAGCDVLDLGMTGTEQVYFAAFHLDVDGGIEVTASHNPIDFNGMKLVGRGAVPISGDSGLNAIKALAESLYSGQTELPARPIGSIQSIDLGAAYVQHLLDYIDLAKIRPLKIVTNAGNGAAGPVIDALEQAFRQQQVPIEFIKIHHQPDPPSPTAFPIRCCRKTVPVPPRQSNSTRLTSVWPGMATLTAAFSLTSTATLSKATTWSACWRKPCWPTIPARKSSTIRA